MSRPHSVPPTPGADNYPPFFAPPPSLEELARQQGVSPVGNLEELRVEFWPESDSIDEFIAAVRRWRHQDR